MKAKTLQKGAILIAILILPTIFFFILRTGTNNFKRLPILGPKTVAEGLQDTIYHTIPAFSFTNHLGQEVTNKDYEGKIYVADFFFATCPTICPKMAVNMLELQKHFYDRSDFRLLSHTVNPEHDSVDVLYDYSRKVYAIDSIWNFVTGPKDSIYSIAFKGYFANAMEDEVAPGGFLHSSNLFLIDREGRIRGVFDGTSPSEVNSLMDAIVILYREEYAPLKDK
jgi:protein SCO1/2